MCIVKAFSSISIENLFNEIYACFYIHIFSCSNFFFYVHWMCWNWKWLFDYVKALRVSQFHFWTIILLIHSFSCEFIAYIVKGGYLQCAIEEMAKKKNNEKENKHIEQIAQCSTLYWYQMCVFSILNINNFTQNNKI